MLSMRTNADVGLLGALLAALGAPVACAGSSDGGTVATTPPPACENETPLVNPATGYVSCSNGNTIRHEVHDCPSSLPRAGTFSIDPMFDACSTDGDCAAQAHGWCNDVPVQYPATFCNYGCVTDAECGAGSICVCGEPVGHCAQALCTSDADCGPGLHCSSYESNPGCGSIAYACQAPGDECAGNADCGSGMYCTLSAGRRLCTSAGCVIGRPFLVSGELRIAPLVKSGAWSHRAEPTRAPLSGEERQSLSKYWASAGLLEHASVAAFARFSLQLLSLGAPAELLELTSQAMADEIHHARLCFGLAERYGGVARGPGALAVEGSLDPSSLVEIVELAILEGCIGETVAALEAAEAASYATDPVVKEALLRISRDEARHAELAWRFVRWALDRPGSELAAVISRTFAAALADAAGAADPALSADELRLLEHGLVPEALRGRIRAHALSAVVGPCAAVLASELPAHGALTGLGSFLPSRT
jgi:hypothetical protein